MLTSEALRDRERESIRSFVESCGSQLGGTVLDYGCGQQPYRDVVEAAGGTYHGYDDPRYPASTVKEFVPFPMLPTGEWTAILCTQVVQYVPDPELLIEQWFGLLAPAKGHLVLTYPTTWPEVEPQDLWRFTSAGMERLLREAGFTIVRHVRRDTILHDGFGLAVGYGVLAAT